MPIRSEIIKYEYNRPNYYHLTDNTQRKYSDKFIMHFEDSDSEDQEFIGIEKSNQNPDMLIMDSYQNANKNAYNENNL